MGLAKNQMIEIEERGYDTSNAFVCRKCIGDKYLQDIIQSKGCVGECSFCDEEIDDENKNEIVLPLETLMSYIMPAIRAYYQSAPDNIPFDKETDSYMGKTIEPYDLVNDDLATYIETDCEELLKEIYRILNIDIQTDEFTYHRHLEDIERWKRYCELVDQRTESAEQIISLCSREDSPKELIEIKDILNGVLGYIKGMGMVDVITPAIPIYRGVTFHPMDYTLPGFSCIPATMIGTAPAKCVNANRYSERGDMVFYGACNKDIIPYELELDKCNPMPILTIGEFYTNKNFNVLDLSKLDLDKCPSIFDLKQRETRETWYFLNELITMISKKIDTKEDDPKEYRPTQVFMKYVQRNTDYCGIEYRSSRSREKDQNSSSVKDMCYALFVTNRNCLDDCERTMRLDTDKCQLFMKEYEQKKVKVSLELRD